MKVTNLFKIALRSLNKNKLRSFLTMLGIIIGVASVIAMLAIGQGSRDNIQQQIASLGTNVIVIFPSASSRGGVHQEAGTSQKLSLQDIKAIKQQCPDVEYVSPMVRSGAQVIAGAQNWRTSVYGVYSDYFPIRNLSTVAGNIFTESEERSAAKVCLVGQTVVTNLFGQGALPVGQYIRINKIPFKIIGILAKKGQNTFGRDQDDIVIAPFSTVQKRMLATTYVQMAFVSAKSHNAIAPASDEITQLLKARHKTPPNEEPDFSIHTQTEISDAASSTAKVLTILLASIASISLLVGGIGIMNIMFVSVTERTREIGIRLAIGARGKDVLFQFLIEAILLSLIGGLIGIGLGVLTSRFVSGFMHWPITVTTDSILISFLFSTFIGIFFGWYPARKAANLNPIDALRYE